MGVDVACGTLLSELLVDTESTTQDAALPRGLKEEDE
jgi:hypothetical protein